MSRAYVWSNKLHTHLNLRTFPALDMPLDKSRWSVVWAEPTVHFILVCQRHLATTFYSVLRAENSMICVNVFYVHGIEISVGSFKRHRISPYTPLINRPLWQRHFNRRDVVKVSDFYNGGLWGHFFQILSNLTEISFLVA